VTEADSGILVIDKPGGMTSHDVVARARRILGTRKVGHAGTLDPMATGVLILGAGRATRLLGHLALRDKAYLATVRLGASTVTDDVEGDVLTAAPAEAVQALDDADIEAALARLVGTIQQRPSSVSAVKVDGRRAYDRVRSGEDVSLPARTVVVSSIDVLDIRWLPGFVDVDIDVTCSTGTYIRALARDAGDDLGVGGHLTSLRRTRVGPFALATALSLDDFAERGRADLLGIDEIADACFPVWHLDAEGADAARVGRRIPWAGPAIAEGPTALVAPDGQFLALATDDAGVARYSAVFA
jgi:tRNA pseudouridine55 synthase